MTELVGWHRLGMTLLLDHAGPVAHVLVWKLNGVVHKLVLIKLGLRVVFQPVQVVQIIDWSEPVVFVAKGQESLFVLTMLWRSDFMTLILMEFYLRSGNQFPAIDADAFRIWAGEVLL
jgi:hypothetical protein